MMKWILTVVIALAVGRGWAQVKEPLPVGAVQFSQQLWLNPADSTVWTGSFGTYINLGGWKKVQALIDQGWTPTQVDSAITANLADYISLSQKGASNGVATLDINSKVPMAQIPDALVGSVNYQGNYNAATNTPTLPASPGPETKGHYYVVSTGGTRFGETFVSGDWIISNGSEWQKVDNNNAVTSVNGQVGAVTVDIPVTSVNSMTGDVVIAKTDIGLGNVDNTSDANKPISTATQEALDLKEDKTNKVTSLSTPNNTTYPTTQAVSNAIDAIEPPEVTGSNGIQVVSDVVSPVYGTTSGTVAQGNDSRINNGQTAYEWGNYGQWQLGATNMSNKSWASVPTNTQFIGDASRTTPGKPAWFEGYAVGLDLQRASNIASQLVVDTKTGTLATRGHDGGTTAWRQYWHSGNFTPPSVFTTSSAGLVPVAPSSGNLFLRRDGSWVDPQAGGGGGSNTDLSLGTRTGTTVTINSSTGTNVAIPSATTSQSGMLSASDKVKLNNALIEESDPSVPSYVKSISNGNISNWNTAYSWGNYGQWGLGSPSISNATWDTYIPTNTQFIGDASRTTPGKPAWFEGYAMGISVQRASDLAALFVVDTKTGTLATKGYDGGTTAWRQYWHTGNFTPSDYVATSNFTWTYLGGKPSTFAPSAHSHSASDINSGILSLSRIPTGTTGSTVALGNHTHSQYVPTSRTINAKALTANLSLTAADVNALPSSGGTLTGNLRINTYFAITQQSDSYRLDVSGSGYSTYNNIYLGRSDNSTGLYYGSGHQIWHSGNFNPSNYAQLGTGSTQVRNNSQLDARYLQSVSAGSGISVSGGNTVAVDGTVIRTTGNQTVGGTKTFTQPVVVANATDGSHAVNLSQLNSVTNNGRLLRNYEVYGNAQTISGVADAPAVGYYIRRIGPSNTELTSGNLLGDGTLVINPQTFVNPRDKVQRTGWITLFSPYAISFIVDRTGGAVFDSGNLFTESTNVTKVIKYDISVSLRSDNTLYMSVMLDYGGQIKVFDQVLSGLYQPTNYYNFTIMASFRGSGETRNLAQTSLSQTMFLPSYSTN